FRRDEISPILSATIPAPPVASTKTPTAPAGPTRRNRTVLQCRRAPAAHRSRSAPDQCRPSTPTRKYPDPNPPPRCPSVPSSTPALAISLPIARTPAPARTSFPDHPEESRQPLPVPCARRHPVPAAPATSQDSYASFFRMEPSPTACDKPRSPRRSSPFAAAPSPDRHSRACDSDPARSACETRQSPPHDCWLRRMPVPGHTSRLSCPDSPGSHPYPPRASAGQSPRDNPCSAALSLPLYAAPPEFLPASKPPSPPLAPTASGSCTTTVGLDRFALHCETIRSPHAAPPPAHSSSRSVCARLPELPCSASTSMNSRRNLASFSPRSACVPCSWRETASGPDSPFHPRDRYSRVPCFFPTLESQASPAAGSDENSRSSMARQNTGPGAGDTSGETACSCPRWDRAERHRRHPASPNSPRGLSQNPSTAPAKIVESSRASANRDLPGP